MTPSFIILATDFALKDPDCPQTEYPINIMSSQQGCLWYKKDDKFKIPKGNYFVVSLNKTPNEPPPMA